MKVVKEKEIVEFMKMSCVNVTERRSKQRSFHESM